MNYLIKNRFLIVFAFALYQLLTQFYFSSYQFLGASSNQTLYYSSLILLFSSIQILFFMLINRKEQNKVLFSSSFLINGLIGSSILWLLFSSKHDHYFTFIFSFLISSFLPSIFFFFFFIFIEATEKLHKIISVSLKTNDGFSEEDMKLFHLENSSGKTILEVSINKIICFEANDNYVVTYYLKNENEMAKSMERVSLKKIEEILTSEEVEFGRVHKSYLINPSYVENVKGRAQAYKIQMKFFQPLIPVSRSYDINLLTRRKS